MSAVPILPKEVQEAQTSNASAASQHLANTATTQTPSTNVTNGTNSTHDSTSSSTFQLHDHPVENQRPLRTIVIGAGYSGIYLGIRLPERLRNNSLVIYEKNLGVGGTWYENRYPGAACDVPSHSYQFSFAPKPDWSSLYAPAPEIREYLTSVAGRYGVERFVKLGHKVVECRWEEEEGKWHVLVQDPDGNTFEDIGDVLIAARGTLNEKAWPEIDGLRDFEGEMMHSADWNEDYDFRNKKIGIIGSGSSAIQILPQLQRVEGTQISAFIRNRTWISPPFAQATQVKYGMEGFAFNESMIENFKSDPEAWEDFRQTIEFDGNKIHALTIRGTEMAQGAQKAFEAGMKDRLAKKPEYYDWLKPQFSPGCRRLTPGPGFLEALVEDNVAYIKSPPIKISAKGIETEDGEFHALDVLVCATGFYASSAPPFPIKGLGGKLLKDHWADRATNYLSITTDGFPNYFMMLGPNGGIGEGSLTIMIESMGDYVVKAVRKLQKENLKSMVVKQERVRDFLEYADKYFEGTVYAEECRSWCVSFLLFHPPRSILVRHHSSEGRIVQRENITN